MIRYGFLVVLILLCMADPASAEGINEVTADYLARTWVLLCACLVFFMQIGFLAFEVGCVRKKNTDVIAMKNVGDWLVTTVVFFLIGFGFMFGSSYKGIIGTSLFLGDKVTEQGGMGWEFFLFQLAFAGTSATIVSGATAERLSFKAYLAITVMMAAFIYPIFGHWVWGNAFLSENDPWLVRLGFIDFAGCSVVHNVGAWSSLVGTWFIGPRIGRYRSDGTLAPLETNGLLWSCVGTLALWFGWWGFNGGSNLEFNESVGLIIFNTNMAGSSAGLAAFIHCALFQRNRDIGFKTLGGILGGLVSITACCHIVTPGSAFVIGVVAGVLHNIAYDLVIRKWKIDDVVGAIPVHGFCGMWGLLSVALFGQSELLPKPMLEQLWVQCIGIVTCFVWTVVSSFILFAFIKVFMGARVSAMHEVRGLRLDENEEGLEED
jgi:Amt family ammonium transporter